MKKVIIVGAGPAGISAALYLQRSGSTEVCVIASGSSSLEKAELIENYYGFAEPVTGRQLYENGIAGAERLGVKMLKEEVVGLTFDESFHPVVQTDKADYAADAVLLATGAYRKAANIKGLPELEGKGVSYCAVCDAFFFRGKDVAVLGSGEYAVHEARTLLPVVKSVTILTNGRELTAPVPESVRIESAGLLSVEGTERVQGVTLSTGQTISVDGLFVAMGVAGSTELARKVGAEVENNRIKVNERMETTLPGLYAAGDCTGGTLQVYKAVYEGATAAFSILRYLKAQK